MVKSGAVLMRPLTSHHVCPKLASAYRLVCLLAANLLVSERCFWSLFAGLLALGLAFAVVFGGDVEGGAFGLIAVAFVIREWALGSHNSYFIHNVITPLNTKAVLKFVSF